MNSQPLDLDAFETHLTGLCEAIRRAVTGVVQSAQATGPGPSPALYRGVRDGAGDVTFGIDVPAEDAALAWAREHACREPLSLLTEELGWIHLGPDGDGGWRELPGFSHGGPRIVLDPIDGTRELMFDMRSAWTVAALAPAGDGMPQLSEVVLGVVSELPDSRARFFRRFSAQRNSGCRVAQLELHANHKGEPTAVPVVTDDSDRVDHARLPFFRYSPAQRAAITDIEVRFLTRIAECEGADLGTIWDDQYLSNAGQLMLLMEGRYRMIADLRAHVPSTPTPTGEVVTSKPYDTAGAILCAREAGCILENALGEVLNHPLDASTPVSFVGYVNEQTRARLRPHLLETLAP